VELNRTTKSLLDEVERVKPSRVVLDSLSELRLMSETPLRYRRQILSLKQFFAGRQCTVLMLDDNTGGSVVDDQVESLAHGVMLLAKTAPDFGVSRRQLRVQKIRGVKFREGNHDLLLNTGGLVIFPRLVAAEHHREFKRECLPSGIAEMDLLLGGGVDRGTSTIFMGPAGTGKSTLALTFALEAARRRDRTLFYTFDETLGTLRARAEGLGLGLEKHLEDGTVKLQQIDPAEVSPGELAYSIKQSVLNEGVRVVVIDSLNGMIHAMPDQRHMTLQLHELLSFLSQQGVSSLMVLTQQGLMGTAMQGPIDLTYLADTVVLLRYFELHGNVRQAISVIKKRSGHHERSIREFRIGKSGIKVGPPLEGFQGILTGVPHVNTSHPVQSS
jgi:circadian clock protein KaiC